jgi:hypothetical protein
MGGIMEDFGPSREPDMKNLLRQGRSADDNKFRR